MPYHVFRHLSAITAVRPNPNDVTCAYQIPWREGGREGWGRGGRRKFYLRVELIKCIDPNEGEALKRGREGGGGGGRREGRRGGGGRGGRKKFYLRVELIKCIDPNEGEALKRGGGGGAEGNFT